MRILIIGAGEAGAYLARVLSREDHEVVMVENDPERIKELEDSLDIMLIQGHGADAGALERAGVFRSDMVLAVTNDDEVNMLASYFAKFMGAGKAIARLKGGAYLGYHRNFYKKALQLDAILVPNELCSREVVELVRAGSAVLVESFAEGKVQMRRMQLDEKSRLAGKRLAKAELPRETLVVAVIRGKEIMIPHGDTELKAGDEILVIGKAEAIQRFSGLQRGGGKDPSLVVIAGGGELGLAVAQALEYADIKVRLVEENRNRAEELSRELEGVAVFHGDATDVNLLREVAADHADVFISACGEDEKNLMSCQLAKNMGAKKTIAIVNKSDYVDIYQQLGIDAAISPRLLVAQEILRFVRSGAINSIAVIAEGKAEVIEIQARPGSKICSAPLAKVGFPKGAILGSVARDNQVFVPDGGFRVQPQDSCIIFTFLENIPVLERMFEGKKKSPQAREGNSS